MPLSGFIFGNSRLILPLLPQKYLSFQNTSLRIGSSRLILSLMPQKYSSFQNTSLKIYIQWRSFNPISFALKILKFSKSVYQDLYLTAII